MLTSRFGRRIQEAEPCAGIMFATYEPDMEMGEGSMPLDRGKTHLRFDCDHALREHW